MNQTITVSIKFIPASKSEDVHRYVDKAISIIDKWGLKYEVGPSNTTIEGPLAEILDKVKLLCTEMEKELDRFALFLDIDYKRAGVTIDGKVKKYRSRK